MSNKNKLCLKFLDFSVLRYLNFARFWHFIFQQLQFKVNLIGSLLISLFTFSRFTWLGIVLFGVDPFRFVWCYFLTFTLLRLRSLRLNIFSKVWLSRNSMINSLTFNMLIVLWSELFKCLISLSLFGFFCSLTLQLSLLFIDNIKETSIFSKKICSSNVKSCASFNFLFKKWIINQGNSLFWLNFLKTFSYLLTKRKPILLLAHFFIYVCHIFLSALLLVFFSHSEYFSIALSDMFDKVCSITNESTFNCVNKRTSSLVKSVATTNL
jgi:hypothetical protein